MGPIVRRTPADAPSRKRARGTSPGASPSHGDEHLGMLDSGADCNTITEEQAAYLPYDVYEHIKATHMIYGNNGSVSTKKEMRVGDYPVRVMPIESAQTLISVAEVVDEGHLVTYDREPQRGGRSRQWKIPLKALLKLTQLRAQHYATTPRDSSQPPNLETIMVHGTLNPVRNNRHHLNHHHRHHPHHHHHLAEADELAATSQTILTQNQSQH
mmetsp:Transcript_16221/g.22351  ORF Transcript_16221/g.22351 Transcript_16221/m.22351 type:complete len:213 (-) Transcript_16221:347-985(-)